MIKKRYFLFTALTTVLLLSVTLTGCSGKKERPDSRTGFEQSMTERDTTAVTQLVNMFFEYLEQGRVTDAVAILYQDSESDRYAEPELLDNDQIAIATKRFGAFPIVAHHIDYIKFNQTYSNEVKVTAIIEEAHDDMPEVKTVFYFKPVDYLGDWRLCLVNSREGDRRIIENDVADSVSDNYKKQLEQKQETAASQQ